MRGLFITLHEEVETRPGHQGPVYKLLCYNGRLLRAIRVLKKMVKTVCGCCRRNFQRSTLPRTQTPEPSLTFRCRGEALKLSGRYYVYTSCSAIHPGRYIEYCIHLSVCLSVRPSRGLMFSCFQSTPSTRVWPDVSADGGLSSLRHDDDG